MKTSFVIAMIFSVLALSACGGGGCDAGLPAFKDQQQQYYDSCAATAATSEESASSASK